MPRPLLVFSNLPNGMKHNRKTVALLFMVAAGLAGLGGLSWISLQVLGRATQPLTPAQRESEAQVGGSKLASVDPFVPAKTFQDVANIPAGLFSYGGSTSWAPIRGTVDQAIQDALPDFQLRYTDPLLTPPGSATGMRMLLDNQLAFAQVSSPPSSQDYQAATKRGYRINPVPVALDAVVFVVNPGLNLSGITLENVKGIYLGEIVNWREIGGPDLPITPFSRQIGSSGTVAELQQQLLDDQPFGKNVKFIRNTTQALRLVNRTPGGIYYASATTVIGQCSVKPLALGRNTEGFVPPYKSPFVPPAACPRQRNTINTEAIRSGRYPFTRRLFVVIKQNGQLDQQAGQAYANLLLSAQGQNLLQEAGFVNLR